jgi:replicative DNA helicase
MSYNKEVKNKLQVNTEYFENVIACNALTNAYYASLVIEHLKPDNFKQPGNKLVVGIVKDFYLKRKSVPTITEIKTYLKKEEDVKLIKETLTNYKQIDLNGNLEDLIQNTETFFKEKTVYNTVLKIVDDFTNDRADYGKFLQMFETACNIKLVSEIGLDLYGEYQKVIDDLSSSTEVIPTGWGFIDSKIGGGLYKKGKALYLFLGPTNVGKSIFLGNIAANVANSLPVGETVVLISLEMSEMMYARRLSSHVSKIPVKELHDQTAALEIYFKDVVEEKKRRLIVKEFPPKSITVGGIKAYLEMLIKNGIKPGIIIIDYLGLVKSSSGDNSYEQGKAVAEDLRAMSYFFECPIVSAIQTNREGMENPSLDTVSESLGVAMTADVIWSLQQEEGDQELGIIKVGGIKNRIGPKHGATAMRLDYATLSLSEEKDYIGLANNSSKDGDEMSNLERKLENITK